jgi:hypothetical protein
MPISGCSALLKNVHLARLLLFCSFFSLLLLLLLLCFRIYFVLSYYMVV